MNTTNGNVKSSYTSMYASGPMALHPSESSIYSYPLYTSGGIYKFTLSNGFAQEVHYKSSSMKFWISAEGERLYKAGCEVLNLSNNVDNDLTYNSILSGMSYNSIYSLADTKIGNKICAIPAVSKNTLYVLDYNYFNLRKKYDLEKFVVYRNTTGTKLFNGEGKYVFISNDGKKAYVLLQATSDSGLLYDWAIQKIDLTD